MTTIQIKSFNKLIHDNVNENNKYSCNKNFTQVKYSNAKIIEGDTN